MLKLETFSSRNGRLPGSIWLAALDAPIDITHAVARAASLHRHFFTIPARLVWPGLNANLPCTHWTWEQYWLIVWHTIIGYSHPHPSPPSRIAFGLVPTSGGYAAARGGHMSRKDRSYRAVRAMQRAHSGQAAKFTVRMSSRLSKLRVQDISGQHQVAVPAAGSYCTV